MKKRFFLVMVALGAIITSCSKSDDNNTPIDPVIDINKNIERLKGDWKEDGISYYDINDKYIVSYSSEVANCDKQKGIKIDNRLLQFIRVTSDCQDKSEMFLYDFEKDYFINKTDESYPKMNVVFLSEDNNRMALKMMVTIKIRDEKTPKDAFFIRYEYKK